MPESSWESLRLDFTQLRRECAINPPIVTAGRLTATWTAQVESEPAHWCLNYRDAKDESGITERFKSRAKFAAARRGFVGSRDDAVSFWLDQLRGYAPEPYVQQFMLSKGPDVPDTLYSIEIRDVCGLSADFCWECEADELLSHSGRAATSASLMDLFREDASLRPLGTNPFPEGSSVHSAFEEATWKAKTKIAPLKLEFLETNFSTPAEFIQTLLIFRQRWFSVTAFEATLIVGNEETAQWYERWIDDRAKWLIEDTLAQLKRNPPKSDPAVPSLFSSEDLNYVESHLTGALMGMVSHYQGVAASRVVEVIEMRNAANSVAAIESEAAASGSVSPAHAAAEPADVQPEVEEIADRKVTSEPRLNIDLISKWIENEGYTNEELAGYLKISVRAVSSMRNDGDYHGNDALTKLANRMNLDVQDLYLP